MASKLSPMMQQYIEIKEQYKDEILFFRLGDFYEMFFEDAKLVSKELELTLTGKNCGLEERAPMCGVPFHSADTYIARLIEKGYKVAICEQTEDPASAKGLVRREVIQVVTPGTLISSTMLRENENNFIASVFAGTGEWGLAYCDISTGELRLTSLCGPGAETSLQDELVKIDAREILMSEETAEAADTGALAALTGAYLNTIGEAFYRGEAMQDAIRRQFHTDSLQGLGIGEGSAAEAAVGSLLLYIHDTQKNDMSHIARPAVYATGDHMSLDKATIRNLELTETLFEKKLSGSLLGVLDKTHTAMGSRLLKQWIRTPLNDCDRINARLDAVSELADDILLRNDLKEELKRIYDFERLAGRIATGKANGRDLIALRGSCRSLPEIKQLTIGSRSRLLQELSDQIHGLEDVYELIDRSIVEEPPFTVKEGGLIREGYSEELDDMKLSIRVAREWIASLEAKERERTGIKNLKVGFNKVFGYYLEVTKSFYDLVPEDYIRKQTLVGSERFVTPQLKETERLVLNAETEINKMEYDLFSEIRRTLQARTADIQQTSAAVARLDALVSFAHVSDQNGYVRPQVDEGDVIQIERGRHPVIELSSRDGLFVSNDTYIDRSDASMLIITGPNMSGKSTYMRQTALIVLMSQIGCFVPASAARIGVCDRIFTRIGASDNLSQGQSTFYVEMSELSYILNTATHRSLVILDEIGRGTSTYDGLSIAWAAAEFLSAPQRRIRTLFATHYHEMTVLEETLRGVRNLNVDVAEENGDIVFLHKIVPGSASRSYGIHVAKLAGAPKELLDSAQLHLEALSGDMRDNVSAVASESADTAKIVSERIPAPSEAFEEEQLSLFAQVPDPISERIRGLDLMNTTPSQALQILEELKEYL
ncbi:MAG: DNA mismatch repair protein MutS [Firmicutes bacterium]|nr:DNA mismatch repair protein MutS [Bacillota bacterium]